LDYSILPASWRDVGELRKLEQECFGEDAWPLWDIVGVLAFPGVERLKAVRTGNMIGFISGEIRPPEGLGWITTLGVMAAFRRHGIAFALLENCEEAMAMPTVRLCVRRSNMAAQQLYQKAGYKPAGVWEKYYNDQEDALVLQKDR
jgi:ribosomal protein S18 acetylase RimI-like enzyme